MLILPYVLCSALCAAMILYRISITGTTMYAWLVVPNLVLAWMPLGFALAIRQVKEMGWRSRGVYLGLGVMWLIFFPNAPYLVTDLVHLRYIEQAVSVYFDIALITLAAMTGLGLAFRSLGILHDLVENATSRLTGWVFVMLTWVLSSIGIYLGRVERWNSWDAVHSPLAILTDLLEALRAGEFHVIVATYSLLGVVLYMAFRRSGPA